MHLNLFYVGYSHVTFKILQHVILFTQKNNQMLTYDTSPT